MEARQEEQRAAIRRTAPMFALYLVVIFGGIGWGIAQGLVRQGDGDPGPARVVDQFAAAIDARSGGAACATLGADTRSELESSEGEPCDQAILALKLSGGEVANVDVVDTSAVVDLSTGDRVFLDETPKGWRISAAGCRPLPGQPYDCELKN